MLSGLTIRVELARIDQYKDLKLLKKSKYAFYTFELVNPDVYKILKKLLLVNSMVDIVLYKNN